MEEVSVLNNPEEWVERRYVRSNQKMAKLVYLALSARDVFGTGVARCFMKLMKVDRHVAQRVLQSPKGQFRR